MIKKTKKNKIPCKTWIRRVSRYRTRNSGQEVSRVLADDTGPQFSCILPLLAFALEPTTLHYI